jgi:plasmid stabilization system protein ParE
MKYDIGFLDDALLDLKEAKNYYKSININLDKRFSRSVNSIIKRIVENPDIFPEKYNQIRVAVIKNFPFTVQYLVSTLSKKIVIVAIFHDKRNPDTIVDRLN